MQEDMHALANNGSAILFPAHYGLLRVLLAPIPCHMKRGEKEKGTSHVDAHNCLSVSRENKKGRKAVDRISSFSDQ